MRPPRDLHRWEHVARVQLLRAAHELVDVRRCREASTSAWFGSVERRAGRSAIAGERRWLIGVGCLQRAAPPRGGRTAASRSISPRAIAASTARSGEAENGWLGRLWQSMQSIRRRSPFAIAVASHPSRHELLHVSRARSVSRTYGITCRLSSVATYSTMFATARVPVDARREAEPLAAAADVHPHRVTDSVFCCVVAVLADDRGPCRHGTSPASGTARRCRAPAGGCAPATGSASSSVSRSRRRRCRAPSKLRLDEPRGARARCGSRRTSRARAGRPGRPRTPAPSPSWQTWPQNCGRVHVLDALEGGERRRSAR